MGIEFNIRTASLESDFVALEAQRSMVEQQIGQPLAWMELPGKKSSRVALFKSGLDPLVEANWPELVAWMKIYLERFDAVFRPLIRSLDTGFETEERDGETV